MSSQLHLWIHNRNPIKLIWQAILWAFDEVCPFTRQPLDVVLNGYNLSQLVGLDSIFPEVKQRDGAVLRFDPADLTEVIR